MQVKARWIKNVVTETSRKTVKMPFERGERRANIRARLADAAKPGRASALA